DSNGVRWAVDIPPVDEAKPPCVADYDLPGYFDLKSGERFTYYRTSTVGHNTLIVNGRNQAMGIEAKVVGFEASPGLTWAVIDLSPAYPDCLSVWRGVALIDRQHVLIVDEIRPGSPIPVMWQWHTRAGVTLEGSTARLHHDDKPNPTKELYLHLLEPSNAVFELQSTEVPPPQAPNTGIRKLAIRIASASQPTRIAVYVSPKRDPFAQLPPGLTGPLASWCPPS
ncbi:MAG: heparinase II/III family protein, partial [Alphaproteobacteria bacterium]|nr:heparinase II/III family protein [Alphaproteobacteria bacterium]